MLDCASKKRHTFGAKNTKSKLTAEQVREIRPLHGKVSSYVVGPRYGVGAGTIRAIWTGKTWTHVK